MWKLRLYKWLFGDNLYGRKLIKIPRIKWEGTRSPEQSVLRLSDAYESKSEELDLELKDSVCKYKSLDIMRKW